MEHETAAIRYKACGMEKKNRLITKRLNKIKEPRYLDDKDDKKRHFHSIYAHIVWMELELLFCPFFWNIFSSEIINMSMIEKPVKDKIYWFYILLSMLYLVPFAKWRVLQTVVMGDGWKILSEPKYNDRQ